MVDFIKELSCDGVVPLGPCSAWPQDRHTKLMAEVEAKKPPTRVRASMKTMVKGLAKTTRQAVFNGKVSSEIREERYDTCKACPSFVADSKRCSDCGCFMEAKTWVGGDPDTLCPLKKWSR